MKMITPLLVDDTSLVNSSLAEDDYPEWSDSTNYQIGDSVVTLSDHSVYEAVADNVGSDPRDTGNTDWFRVGSTNRWKVFDSIIGDPATGSNSVTYTIKPSDSINAVACFGVSAQTVSLVVNDPTDGVVYSQTISLLDYSFVTDWYEFFFSSASGVRRSEAIFDLVPLYPDAEFLITFEGQDVEIGQIVFGREETIGITLPGTSVGGDDYSQIDRDAQGRVSVVERDYSQTVDFSFAINTNSARRTQQLIFGRRGKATVFYTSASRVDIGTLVYGIAKPLEIDLSTPEHSYCSLTVEGLV